VNDMSNFGASRPGYNRVMHFAECYTHTVCGMLRRLENQHVASYENKLNWPTVTCTACILIHFAEEAEKAAAHDGS